MTKPQASSSGPALTVRPFIPPENVTRKRRGDIIMTGDGYVRYVSRNKPPVPYNPASWRKRK